MPDQILMSTDNSEFSSTGLPRLSVIGLGKLGAPMAAVFAGAGYKVCGLDVDTALVELFEQNTLPFEETGLKEQIARSRSNLVVTTEFDEAVQASDISFVIVPTPTGADGLFSNDYIVSAVKALGEAIAQKDSYHLVVITSTVMPGATGGVIKDALENTSGRTIGESLGLCYSPEFIALGSVLRDMKNPDLVLIGESDPKAGDLLEQIYHQTCENTPQVRRMAFSNAELAKIAINTFVTTKISYINMLSAICDQIEGGDVDAVSSALGADSRIGSKYIRGGAAYGGPCFPRDNKALAVFAETVGVNARIAKATDGVNQDQVSRLLTLAKVHCPNGGEACILGLSYKPDTAVVEESAGLRLAEALESSGYTIRVYDPMGEIPIAPKNTRPSLSAAEAALGAQVIFVMTPWPEFQQLPEFVAEAEKPLTIIDPWRLFSADAFGANVTYVALGRP